MFNLPGLLGWAFHDYVHLSPPEYSSIYQGPCVSHLGPKPFVVDVNMLTRKRIMCRFPLMKRNLFHKWIESGRLESSNGDSHCWRFAHSGNKSRADWTHRIMFDKSGWCWTSSVTILHSNLKVVFFLILIFYFNQIDSEKESFYFLVLWFYEPGQKTNLPLVLWSIADFLIVGHLWFYWVKCLPHAGTPYKTKSTHDRIGLYVTQPHRIKVLQPGRYGL